MSSITSLTVLQLRKAASLREKIQALEKEFTQLFGSSTQAAIVVAPKKKFKMSAAAKAKISAAAKARWAKVKKVKTAAKPAPKAKRKMSATAKAKLSAKMKEIWAKRAAAKK